MSNEASLFDRAIPVPTTKQIRAKIKVSSALPRAQKIADKVLFVVKEALESSHLAAEYLSFLFHHPDFSLQVVSRDEVAGKSQLSTNTGAFIHSDNTHGLITALYHDKFIEDFSVRTILHEGWHGFWQLIKFLPDMNKTQCPTSDLTGTPLPAKTIGSIEKMRKELAQFYQALRRLYVKLDKGRPPLAPHERAFVDTLSPEFIPRSYPLVVTAEQRALLRRSKPLAVDWHDDAKLHVWYAGWQGGEPRTRVSCAKKTKVCAAMGVVGDTLHSLRRYEAHHNVVLNEPVAKQLPEELSAMLKELRTAGFSVVDPGNQANLGLAVELFSRDNPDMKTLLHRRDQFAKMVEKIQSLATLCVEADTLPREYPGLLNFNETQSVLAARKRDVRQWQECSPQFFAHIPEASVVKPEVPVVKKVVPKNACVAIPPDPFLQLLSTGVTALLVSFVLSAVDTGVRQTRPKLASALLAVFKLMVVAAMLLDDKPAEAALMAAAEVADYVGFKATGSGLRMAGFFASDDSGESAAVALGAGVAGQYLGAAVFGR